MFTMQSSLHQLSHCSLITTFHGRNCHHSLETGKETFLVNQRELPQIRQFHNKCWVWKPVISCLWTEPIFIFSTNNNQVLITDKYAVAQPFKLWVWDIYSTFSSSPSQPLDSTCCPLPRPWDSSFVKLISGVELKCKWHYLTHCVKTDLRKKE